jgi:peptidyl-tRNA hydrolase
VAPNDRKMIDRILSDFKKAEIKILEETIHQKIKAIEKRIIAKRSSKYVN